MDHLLRSQNEDRRIAAIKSENELEYARTFYQKDINTMRHATEIEDMIFDYFGIVEMQFEAANQFFKNSDTGFDEERLKLREECKATVDLDFDIDDKEQLKSLTKEKAAEYLQQIRAFTQTIVSQFASIDQNTGRQMLNINDRRFDIMHQKEKDKFYMETGFYPEQISKFMRQEAEKEREANPGYQTEALQRLRDQLVATQSAFGSEDAAEGQASTKATDDVDSKTEGSKDAAKPAALQSYKTVTLE